MTQDTASIRQYMTLTPVSIGRTQTVADAVSLMKTHRVRHLPVVDAAGSVIGVLSQRDLQLVARRWDLDDKLLSVDLLAVHDVFTISPEAPLDAVCATMAEHHYGCAVVVHDRRPIGIFTTTDACAALASFARNHVA